MGPTREGKCCSWHKNDGLYPILSFSLLFYFSFVFLLFTLFTPVTFGVLPTVDSAFLPRVSISTSYAWELNLVILTCGLASLLSIPFVTKWYSLSTFWSSFPLVWAVQHDDFDWARTSVWKPKSDAQLRSSGTRGTSFAPRCICSGFASTGGEAEEGRGAIRCRFLHASIQVNLIHRHDGVVLRRKPVIH